MMLREIFRFDLKVGNWTWSHQTFSPLNEYNWLVKIVGESHIVRNYIVTKYIYGLYPVQVVKPDPDLTTGILRLELKLE